MTAGRTLTASCEIGSCDGDASGHVTDYDGNDRSYCEKHVRQMGNLAGWSRKEAAGSSLWAQFSQWCSMSGISPSDPSALMGFSAATGVDQAALAPLVQQHGAQGVGTMPSMPSPGGQHGTDDLSGLSDRDLTIATRGAN
ncbi:hypothetical protein E3_0690 [Rhodococcus phage E3]|uniref:hypothetical protein n=1 Tax=Rhodococcus phage E3 TaxID=1007869 RepID=UPI0002C6CB38|nr:hypothetical protein M176_gp073 [Rhodococcus phage E3]AEQ20983.1 hypothetical protein E3_0690 [Rhodococcus phage E3]